MKSRKRIFSAVGIACLAGLTILVWRGRNSPKESASQVQRHEMQISLSDVDLPRLTVIFTNGTQKPQRIWKRSNSWGSRCLRFDFCPAGTNELAFAVERKFLWFNKNIPVYHEILPDQSASFKINMADKTWFVTAYSDERPESYDMRCVYEVEETPEAKERDVQCEPALQSEAISIKSKIVLDIMKKMSRDQYERHD